MLATFSLQGLVVGMGVSAPLGPVGIWCIRRAVARGWAAGWVTGLGAAAADVLCACAAGFGLESISTLMLKVRPWPGLAGAVIVGLVGLGLCVRSPAPAPAPATDRAGSAAEFLAAAILTLGNPLTLLSLLAIFSGLGLGVVTTRTETTVFIAGLAAGAALWWLLLSLGAAALARRLEAMRTGWVDRLAGFVLVGLGVFLAVASWP